MNAPGNGMRSEQSMGQQARERLLTQLPLTEHRRDLAGARTVVLEGGSGPPIVFLQAEFALVWMRVIPDLVATHRVVAPDLPGLGESGSVDGSYDVARALDWLGELIEQTCDAPPALVGKATGGALAARFAVDHGERIDRLVLVDSHGLDRFRPPSRMALSYLSVMLRPTERGVERSFRTYCFTDLDRVRAEMGDRWDWLMTYVLDRFRTPSVKAAMRSLMPRLSKAIPPEDLARITVPTTLIWGRHDVGVPVKIAESASTRYGWPLHVIDGARDDPALEQPGAFLDALHASLNRATR